MDTTLWRLAINANFNKDLLQDSEIMRSALIHALANFDKEIITKLILAIYETDDSRKLNALERIHTVLFYSFEHMCGQFFEGQHNERFCEAKRH